MMMTRNFLSFILAVLAFGSTYAFTGYTPVFGVKSQMSAQSRCYAHGSSTTLVMRARECDLLGKRANRQARAISFSHVRTKTVQQVNLQWKRFFSEQLGRKVRLRLSAKGIKTIDRIGNIDTAAKEFKVDLTKF